MTAAACVLLTTTSAHAGEGKTLFTGGNWTTTYYESNNGGEPMCVANTFWEMPNRTLRMLMLKWTGEIGLFVHIAKTGWRFTGRCRGAASDCVRQWRTRWHRLHAAANRQGRRAHRSRSTSRRMPTASWLISRNAREITISFPSGNEPPWKGQMNGSRKAGEWFAACIRKIRGEPVATSPIAPSQPQATSPVSKPQPAPTSPVKPTAKKDDGSV